MNLLGKNILKDIENEVKQYQILSKGKTPLFIIINDNDTERLLTAMYNARLIPDTKSPKKIVISSQRVIRTNDIPEGSFAVVGEL